MALTGGMQWDLFDFLIMGVLLFTTGLTYVLMTRMSSCREYRLAFGIAVVAWVVWRPTLAEPPGLVGVFLLNAFFAALLVLAGWLFKRAAGRPR
jgi:hypothetical protein